MRQRHIVFSSSNRVQEPRAVEEIRLETPRHCTLTLLPNAAFAKPKLYEALEERDVKCAIRLPANDNLQREHYGLVDSASGRSSHKPVVRFKSFLYQAASWQKVRTTSFRFLRFSLINYGLMG